MGEKVKRNHAIQFKHGQDEAYGKLSDPNLFSKRRELLTNGFRCTQNGRPISVGSKVTLLPQADGHVAVVCGNSLAGYVVEEDCNVIRELNLKEPVLLVAEITEQSSVSGDFVVACEERANGEDVDDIGGCSK